jgi:RNA polymerase sigma-70 factor (ECF subfamily)
MRPPCAIISADRRPNERKDFSMAFSGPPARPPWSAGAGDAESSMALLVRAQAGDRDALEHLIARYLPRMRRWAHGRLPQGARGLADTSDVVQETVISTFKQIERFEVRGEGALQAYLRQGLMNRIRDHGRRASRRPVTMPLEGDVDRGGPSPLERAVGQQLLDRYEDALARLRAEDRELIVARVELGLDIDELTAAFNKPTPAATRKAVARALMRLAHEMDPAR